MKGLSFMMKGKVEAQLCEEFDGEGLRLGSMRHGAGGRRSSRGFDMPAADSRGPTQAIMTVVFCTPRSSSQS